MNSTRSDQPAPIHRQTLYVGANPGRRKILALAIASACLPPLARAASSVATVTTDHNFMALSLFATGRSKLDPEIGTKLFAALRESDASFAGAADSLAADAASGRYPDVESLESAIRGTPKHAALLALVVGLVHGDGFRQGQASGHHTGRRAHVSADRRRKPYPRQLRGGHELVGSAVVSRAR